MPAVKPTTRRVSPGYSTRRALLAPGLLLLAWLCSLAPPALSQAAQQLGPWQWSGVGRIVVIPDIHGAYPDLVRLLQATGVIDDALNWSGGTSHLVSLGDLLDRGAESRQVMDLLMRLQEQAPGQGGRVHVVAGNHEAMNLVGDLRYVSDAEFAAFRDMESPTQRQQAYSEFLARRSESLALSFLGGGVTAAERDPQSRLDFEALYPPGYFGHRGAFAPEGKYGSWLLSLPVILVINDTAFVHGGLPPVTSSAPIDALNQRYLTELKRFFELWRTLIDAGVLTQENIETNLTLAHKALRVADPASCVPAERAACARERGSATDRQRSPRPEVVADLRELLALESSPMFGATGPLWYRGSVRCKDVLEIPVLQAALDNLATTRVVVGHTPTTDRRVHQLRNDRLVMLDTGMLTSRYHGRPAALVIDGPALQVQYLNPTERVTPLGDGGNREYPFSTEQLGEALRTGEVIDIEQGWFETTSHVQLSYGGAVIDALFFPADKKGSEQRELAAYRLDTLLGFDLVPITVERQIDGEPGVLQLAYRQFLTESQRARQKIDTADWCPLPVQQQLLAVFDLLIGHDDRPGSTYGYTQPLWNLQSSHHGDAFSSSESLPDDADGMNLQLPPTVRASLQALGEPELTGALGQLLDREQIAALLARRDALLALMPGPAESYDQPATAATGDRRQ